MGLNAESVKIVWLSQKSALTVDITNVKVLEDKNRCKLESHSDIEH
jgi:hypothetical protein